MTNTADIVLFTVNEFETQEVWRAFKKTAEARARAIGPRMYWDYGEICGARVLHTQSSMADLGADEVARDAMQWCQPALLIAVGIAWGADRTKQKIGDILVADPLVDADYDKRSKTDGGTPRGDSFSQSAALRSILSMCAVTRSSASPKPDGKLRVGRVLSLPTLVDDPDERNRLLKTYRGSIGGEMEGRGFVNAAVQSKCDWLLVKAICDWGYGKNEVEGEKDRDQPIAARNAADFVRYAVEHGLASYALHQRAASGATHAVANPRPAAAPMISIGVVHGNVTGSIETQTNYFGRTGGEGT